MAVVIDPGDLHIPIADGDEDRVLDTISAVIARAARFAPCILTDVAVETAAKGILVDVIVRRLDRTVRPGLNVTKAAGNRSLSIDGSGVPSVPFWPAEVTELQSLCSAATSGQATTPVWSFPDAQTWPDGLCAPRVTWPSGPWS